MVKFGKTWADMEATPQQVSWRGIRGLRASPPGRAGGDRQDNFWMALEQAEQLFTAAAHVEAAARPLVLFYGLSQAGRALVASRAGDPWTFRTHGIGEVQDVNSANTGVADFHIEPYKSGVGAFVMVAKALNSSGLPGPTRLGDLWPLLREARRFPLPNSGSHRLLDVSVNRQGGHPMNGEVSNLPDSLGVPRLHGEPTGPRTDWGEEEGRVRDFLASYPALAGYEFGLGGGQPIGFTPHGDGTASVRVHWPDDALSGIDSGDALRKQVATKYSGHSHAYPCIDGSGKALHPLVVWWAVLFGLSILARYEPEAWGRAIDVNNSADAVAIEHVLDSALGSLPELLLRCLIGDL